MTNAELLETYRANRKVTDPVFFNMINSPVKFKLYMLGKLPMGLIAGLKVKSCDDNSCQITVPYKWVNQNPFKSTYFAVLAMAAEMSTGMMGVLCTYDAKPSISMLVTGLEASFTKKATGITTFTCQDGKAMSKLVEETILTCKPGNFTATSIGTSKTGEVEATFKVQWSFKARLK